MFATEFSNFFKLERKKAEIGKYLIIQKYEIVCVLKVIIRCLFSDNQMSADVVSKRIYHICNHIFGEVIILQGQEKLHFIIHNLSFM